MLVGTKILDCHHGKDRNVRMKERKKKKKRKKKQDCMGKETAPLYLMSNYS